MVHHLVAAIIIQGDRILLGQRSPGRAFWPDVWDVFGGHVEPDEQPDQTLVREVQEELDISPTQWRQLEVLKECVPARANVPAQDLIVHLYCVTAWNGSPVNRQPEEHSLIQWFSYAEAIQLDLAHPSYPRLFAQCLAAATARKA
jgi:8-oxo-dGTP pyrophosphatase MutT (NUDIX family)